MTVQQTPLSSAAVPLRDLANAIRALSMDAVEAANSGHPGMPMGMADVASVLFTRFLKFDPAAHDWPDRDRFMLSAGHGSMLLYSLLYLTGYPDMTLEELKNFRQLRSCTAGHPEYGHAAGIETTTGPLGQGLANAVGMALAERMLNARFGNGLVDHYTYVIAGDGCLMEGISHEAIDFAGHLRLSKLIVLFDDNSISIDGATSLSTSTDQPARFTAAGWDVHRIDGHNEEQIISALEAARRSDRPSLIACKTVIGYGAPNKQGTASAHGSPLGKDEIGKAREALGWSHPPFEIPAPILDAWRSATAYGQSERQSWLKRMQDDPRGEDLARLLSGRTAPQLGEATARLKAQFAKDAPKLATRQSSQAVLEELTAALPGLIGGSADLTPSNGTRTKAAKPVKPGDFSGTYIHYGVREHAMAAAMNGIALHGGLIPFGGTFLCFADYSRPAIRLGALMGIRVIHVMTHELDRPGRRRPDAPAGGAFRGAEGDPEPQPLPSRRCNRNRRSLASGAGSGAYAFGAVPVAAGAAGASAALGFGAKSHREGRLCRQRAGRAAAGHAAGDRLRGSACRRRGKGTRRRRHCRGGRFNAVRGAVPQTAG